MPDGAGDGSTYPILFAPTPNYLIEAENAIQKTLDFTELNGKWQNPRERQNYKGKLRRIAKNTDIFNVDQVKTFIMKLKKQDQTDIADSTKMGLQVIYANFAEANNLPFTVSNLKKKSPIPLIPSKENVDTIINSTPQKWYVPLAIMAETATEAEELHQTDQTKQIDKENGTISIIGVKDHNNGTYKLSPPLAEALRQYLAKHTDPHPFPESRRLGEAWRRYRDTRAKELNKPELRKIPMKNLRNYAGAIFYTTMGKDPIATMNFMRHKKLETTMHYLRGLTLFTTTQTYISKIATTAEEAIELLNQGFKEEAIFGEKHLYRKLK